MDKAVLVAIDLGAESCRVSLLRWINGAPDVRLVHRFANGPVTRGGSLHWDLEKIMRGVEKGLRLCADLAGSQKISAIAVDGWAVDYVRRKPDGTPIGDPFCYRDERTVEAAERVHQIIPLERLYSLTGIQFLRLNTIYQLYADGLVGIDQCARIVSPYFGRVLVFAAGKRGVYLRKPEARSGSPVYQYDRSGPRACRHRRGL